MIKAADGIIVISESTKKDLIRILGIQGDKIKVVYLANSLCKSIEIPPVIQKNYILYVGVCLK